MSAIKKLIELVAGMKVVAGEGETPINGSTLLDNARAEYDRLTALANLVLTPDGKDGKLVEALRDAYEAHIKHRHQFPKTDRVLREALAEARRAGGDGGAVS